MVFATHSYPFGAVRIFSKEGWGDIQLPCNMLKNWVLTSKCESNIITLYNLSYQETSI